MRTLVAITKAAGAYPFVSDYPDYAKFQEAAQAWEAAAGVTAGSTGE